MTTKKGSGDALAAFEKSLLECLDDLNGLLPGLSRRYEMPVIATAMAEHVGSALQVLLRKKLCNVRQVDLILQQIETCAFHGPASAGAIPGSPH